MTINDATWGYPRRRPYWLLALVAVVGAAQALTVAIVPPTPGTARWAYAAIGVLALVLAVVLVTVGPKAGPWLLIAAVALATLLVEGVTLLTRTGEGQLLAGFSFAMLGVFAAYFLPTRVVYVYLVAATVLFLVTILVNPQLEFLWHGIVVALLTVGITLVVSSLVQHLRRMALHDPLTGALNRQALVDGAERAHLLDERGHVPTTVVEIDLDGFKQYNDAHGHVAGDDLLAGIVRDWSGVLRRTDLLARTGGDEFVLILPATGSAEAEALLQRMREANPARWSAGVAQWRPGERMPEVLRRADVAMYEHKPSRRGPAADASP